MRRLYLLNSIIQQSQWPRLMICFVQCETTIDTQVHLIQFFAGVDDSKTLYFYCHQLIEKLDPGFAEAAEERTSIQCMKSV